MSTIITRNSANSGSVPSSLVQGELAINVTDGRLFYGSGSGNDVKEFGTTSSYALNALSASYAETASYAPDYLPLTGGTINGDVTVNGTASIAFLNVSVESASVIYSSGSNQFGDASNDVQTLWGTVDIKSGPVLVTGSVIANSFTGSLLGTASYAIQALSASYAITASYALTASYVNPLYQQILLSGSLKLDPTQDPDPLGIDLDSTVLFQSSSNTTLGYDLYVRQNGNLVKWKWVEGILETGLLYGGVVTYSGSNVFVSPGSGIIAEHNATTGSEISPMIEYVTWNAITQSITNIATQQVTYLYIDNNGTLQQQSTRFTSQQYHSYIPLGAVGHFDYTQVSAFGGQVQTAYDQISQISNFVDAFGPLKMSGYGLTGQAGSLRLSVGSGTSFIHGGFYQNDPEFPSQITTPSQATASLARINRSGSVIEFDTNAGNLYTAVDPTKYDRDGDGTLANVGSGNWSIQRVFTDPKTGILYVYYGQERYTTLLNALQYLPTDPFTEGDTFDFTTFLGYLVLRGNASDLTDTNNNAIINGGLFRGSGQGSGGGAAISNLDDLSDVSITGPNDGEALVYNAGIWINSYPTTASYALTASYVENAQTASYVLNAVSASYALSASYAPAGNPFPFNGDAQISGSLGVTGSFNLQTFNGLTDVTAISFDGVTRLINDVMGSTSINADDRDLYDSSAINSVNWEIRRLTDTYTSRSIDWENRYLHDTSGNIIADWSLALLLDTGSNNSVDWQNRITIDTGTKTSIDWQNRQLKDSNGNENLNWSSGVSITGSLTVSGSSTFTNIGPAQFSGSFVVQGDLIPGFPPFIPDIGPYDAIKVDDITGQRLLYGSPFQGASASIDFGNRDLLDNSGNGVFNWNGIASSIDSRLYLNQTINATTRDSLVTNIGYGGFSLDEVAFDSGVQDFDLVFLDTDGIWYQVDQSTDSSTKMLGICQGFDPMTNIGTVITEGDIVVSSGPGYPAVQNPDYGLPVYIRESGGTLMSTVIPTTGYVRLLGHCYHNPGAGTEWIMKFRPSHEWIEL